MTHNIKVHEGYGFNFHNMYDKGIYVTCADALLELINMAPKYAAYVKEKLNDDPYWHQVDTNATSSKHDLYAALGFEDAKIALATILKEVIAEVEGIQLVAVVDFSDSDNIILAYTEDCGNTAPCCIESCTNGFVKCRKCGVEVDPSEYDIRYINEGTEEAYAVCEVCFNDMWDKDEIIKCDGCGRWYENGVLHRDPDIKDFVPCPVCSHDVVEGTIPSLRQMRPKLDKVFGKYLRMIRRSNRYNPMPEYLSWTEKVPEQREFIVDTPLGKLKVYAKHNTDTPADYPGVYVDLVDEVTGNLISLTTVEYNPTDHRLQTIAYGSPDLNDEPTALIIHKDGDEGDV